MNYKKTLSGFVKYSLLGSFAVVAPHSFLLSWYFHRRKLNRQSS